MRYVAVYERSEAEEESILALPSGIVAMQTRLGHDNFGIIDFRVAVGGKVVEFVMTSNGAADLANLISEEIAETRSFATGGVVDFSPLAQVVAREDFDASPASVRMALVKAGVSIVDVEDAA